MSLDAIIWFLVIVVGIIWRKNQKVEAQRRDSQKVWEVNGYKNTHRRNCEVHGAEASMTKQEKEELEYLELAEEEERAHQEYLDELRYWYDGPGNEYYSYETGQVEDPSYFENHSK